ncbi:hypothetical protein QVD17_09753 [Tagetes erecta]|uniref:DUF4005 domain-containing protein n=1 Tax=Tagetes erecta TaxID=13708 RepID=A0AAD8L4Y6_TARER|nr:hypothetical protein QVD17_09753 [Tagetes erecta]
MNRTKTNCIRNTLLYSTLHSESRQLSQSASFSVRVLTASFRSGGYTVRKVYQLEMGKSPGKWIKTVLFGKKSSKSNLSKNSTLDKKTSVTINSHSKDLGSDSMTISSPVRHVINVSGEHTLLDKSSSANLMHVTSENLRNTANDGELIRLEQAATKAQAAFRGYLARRSFWALKGIIRLQALARGHLVRRQAVATLTCMRAIVEFQALIRGQIVRLSRNGPQFIHDRTPGDPVEQANLLQTSLKSEKLSKNAFGVRLVNSSKTTMPLNIQYDPDEPNSVTNWLERWSSSHFWDPLPQPNKALDIKPKRKQNKSQAQETETTRPKRIIRKVSAPSLDTNNHSSEVEKAKRNASKISTLQQESVQDQSHSELEKVKHSLRKISVSAAGGAETSTVEKVDELDVMVSEPLPAPSLEDKSHDVNPPVEPPPPPVHNETNGKIENVELNDKENQKTRRRKSFPAKQEYSHSESVSQNNTPTVPSYMAATESAKAKLRAQAAAKAAEDGAENGFVRRHSLPSSTGKLSLQSPRVQKLLHANGKGLSKTNKPQISPRDEKVVSAGWRR